MMTAMELVDKLFMTALAIGLASCTAKVPPPYGSVPTAEQLEWQKMEMNMFCHFGPNTFTGAEWGSGAERENVFAPADLDCRQWASTARRAGFKGLILTAKHHDGFCLWPNPESRHTVAQSSWRDGRGDVLNEFMEACKSEGLKAGIYISPWDRNDPNYGSEAYNNVYVKTLRSALSYGEIFELWFDGANGEGPGGKRQRYDWTLFRSTVRSLRPGALMFSDVGPDCRWVGDEAGVAGETNWSSLDTCGFEPGLGAPPPDTLMTGNRGAGAWVPAECDVSIRPGWFWKASETSLLKSVNDLLSIYYTSVGRNALLLLNVPPDTSGRIDRTDSLRLMEFRAALTAIFSENLASGAKAEATDSYSRLFKADNVLDGDYDSYWAAGKKVGSALELIFDGPKTFNRVCIQEYIPLGQRVEAFTVEVRHEGKWTKLSEASTIGYKRILLVPQTTADALRVTFDSALAEPLINNLALYQDSILSQDFAQRLCSAMNQDK